MVHGNGHGTRLLLVLELLMAARLPDFIPAFAGKPPDHLASSHILLYTQLF